MTETLETAETAVAKPVDVSGLVWAVVQTLDPSAAIRRLMWDRRSRMFVDYVWQRPETAMPLTAAGLFPLFLEVADRDQAVTWSAVGSL
jgi:hypothetical protein